MCKSSLSLWHTGKGILHIHIACASPQSLARCVPQQLSPSHHRCKDHVCELVQFIFQIGKELVRMHYAKEVEDMDTQYTAKMAMWETVFFCLDLYDNLLLFVLVPNVSRFQALRNMTSVSHQRMHQSGIVSPNASRAAWLTMICSPTLRSCMLCVHPGHRPSGADSSMPIRIS